MTGKLFIVSTGPGGTDYLTTKAQEVLENSDLIVGYNKYLEDITSIIHAKETFSSGMTEEILRVNRAIDEATSGKTVSLISNGDVNVYGLASLAIELIDERDLWNQIEVESIPGVTVFLAVASKMGAPISQDFSVISLSDRLTPIELIQKRIESALDGDFVLGVYNPKSKRRIEPYKIFIEALNKPSLKERVIIVASDVGRPDEKIHTCKSDDLIQKGVDNIDIHMSTVIIVGNSSTRWTLNNRVLTP